MFQKHMWEKVEDRLKIGLKQLGMGITEVQVAYSLSTTFEIDALYRKYGNELDKFNKGTVSLNIEPKYQNRRHSHNVF